MADVATETTSTRQRSKRDRWIGVVSSDKGDKTITVRCDRLVKHPQYGKYLRRRTQLRAHDEKNEAKVGDKVEVVACRRLSKTKCWRLQRVIAAADSA